MAARKKYPDGTKRMSFFIPPELKRRLEERSARTNRSYSDIILRGLELEFADASTPEAAVAPENAFG